MQRDPQTQSSPSAVGKRRLRALVFGGGMGMFPPLMERFRQEFDIVGVFSTDIPLFYRWLFLLRSFRLPKAAWRRRWYHYREKTAFAFLARTRSNAEWFGAHAGQFDIILHFGAVNAPSFQIDRPMFIFTDSTRGLSSRNEYDEVSHFLDSDEQREWLGLEGSVYRVATRIFVGSQFVKNSLVTDYGVAEERVFPTGFGAGLGHAGIYEKHFDRRSVLFIGKGDFEKKGGTLLMEAFKQVRERVPDATLHLVGQDRVPEMPSVVNHGFVADRARLRELMKSAHVFVLPSLTERFGIALIEAMAASTPVIASDYGALPEIVGDSGMVVRRNDPDGLAQAIVRLLTDTALAKQFGENGRRRFEQKYNWDSVWAQMKTEIYRAVEAGEGNTARRLAQSVTAPPIDSAQIASTN